MKAENSCYATVLFCASDIILYCSENKIVEIPHDYASTYVLAHTMQLISNYDYFVQIKQQISCSDMSESQRLALSILEQYHTECPHKESGKK